MSKYNKKKIICVLFFTFLAAVMLAGCMTGDEKKKAEKYEKTAFWKTCAYLWKQYGSIGFVSNMSDLAETDGYWGYFAEHATPYVQADVWLWGEKFNVVVNVDTGECYDNRNAEETREQIEAYLYDKIDLPAPEYLEVYFNPAEISSMLDKNVNGYMPSGKVPEVEDLFSDSGYEISILLEYADDEIDFDAVDIEDLCEAGQEGPSVRLTFANYCSSQVCGSGLLTAGECKNSTFMDAELLYYGKDIYSVYFDKNYDNEKDTFQYAGTVTDIHRHYRTETVNNLRFIWDEEGYDVELKETAAPGTFYSAKDDSTLAAESDMVVAVTCRRKQWFDSEKAVLCVEEQKPSSYKTVFWEDADQKDSAQIWTMADIGENDCYHWISTKKDDASVMLGIYQKK